MTAPHHLKSVFSYSSHPLPCDSMAPVTGAPYHSDSGGSVSSKVASSSDTITNTVFGLCAVVIGALTIWQGRRVWRLWYMARSTGPVPRGGKHSSYERLISLADCVSFGKTRATNYQGRSLFLALTTLRALGLEVRHQSCRLTILLCLRLHHIQPPLGYLTNRLRSTGPWRHHHRHWQDRTVPLTLQARRIQM